MSRIKIGVFGFGQTGKLVVNEFIKDERFNLVWVVRKGKSDIHKYASRLLGYEKDCGEIFSIEEITGDFFKEKQVDVIIDFSDSSGVQYYKGAADAGIRIISAVSKYEPEDQKLLYSLADKVAVLHSPNITLGINILLVASQIIQKIAPHADIEIVEEHFKGKREVSGTARKIANVLGLDEQERVNSIRVGGIVGHHEVIFGMPYQTIRLTHDSISRAAFGQGAIFAAIFLRDQPKGIYSMENIVAEMFSKHRPVY